MKSALPKFTVLRQTLHEFASAFGAANIRPNLF